MFDFWLAMTGPVWISPNTFKELLEAELDHCIAFSNAVLFCLFLRVVVGLKECWEPWTGCSVLGELFSDCLQGVVYYSGTGLIITA